jgi:hypothetical protein
MSAVLQDLDCRDDDDDEQGGVLRWADARRQDEYWGRAFRHERYFRPGLDYEDYAPAYCVGYAGCAQYGGSFEDAQRSLCANWERIKGDSRLALDEAMPAMHAAWRRMERGNERPAGRLFVGAFRRLAKASSFKPDMAVAR